MTVSMGRLANLEATRHPFFELAIPERVIDRMPHAGREIGPQAFRVEGMALERCPATLFEP
jgi:hypothetical protein